MKIQLLDTCAKLRQDFKILHGKQSISTLETTPKDAYAEPEIMRDIKEAGTITDFFAIPTHKEIIQLDSYTYEEMNDMLRDFNGLNFKVTKSFNKELDSVVHPTDEYSSAGSHHQPHFTQAEDLEHSIREMFKEFKNYHYKAASTSHIDAESENRASSSVLTHDVEGGIGYNTFLYKLLEYYSMVHRIFKLEYFTSKAASKTLDVLEMERHIYNGNDFWEKTLKEDMELPDDTDNYELISDSEDSRNAEHTR